MGELLEILALPQLGEGVVLAEPLPLRKAFFPKPVEHRDRSLGVSVDGLRLLVLVERFIVAGRLGRAGQDRGGSVIVFPVFAGQRGQSLSGLLGLAVIARLKRRIRQAAAMIL